jgi:hypothetical protein
MNAIATAAIVITLFAAVGAVTGLYLLVLIGLRARARLKSAVASGADHANPSRSRLLGQGDVMRPRGKANPNLAWLKHFATRSDRHGDAGTTLQ